MTDGGSVEQGPSPQQSSEGWWSRLPTWAKWTIGVVGALIILVVGAAIGGSGSKESELKDEVAALEADVVGAEQEATDAKAATRATKQRVRQRSRQIYSKASEKGREVKEEAQEEASKIKGELEQTRSEVTSAQNELADAEGRLESVQGSIVVAKEEKAKSTITDGVWQLEVDYAPGVYEAPGGDLCYWALLNGVGGELEDIAENGGFNSHQVLEITTPYFETRECGTWHRIG